MSTYEARQGAAVRVVGARRGFERQVVTSEQIEAAMQRGRRERSLALWSVLRAVFARTSRHGGEKQTAQAQH